MTEELMGSVLSTVEMNLSPREKEDLVLFPDTHSRKMKLLDVEFEVRPLSISASKKLSKRIAPVTAQFEQAMKEGKDGGGSDVGNPELDIDTMDALLDCVVIMAQFYKLPSSINRERIEDEAAPEEILDLLKLQLMVNRDNNFLLQNLRSVVRVIDLAALLPSISPNLPSMPPTASDSASDSESLSTTTPAGS